MARGLAEPWPQIAARKQRLRSLPLSLGASAVSTRHPTGLGPIRPQCHEARSDDDETAKKKKKKKKKKKMMMMMMMMVMVMVMVMVMMVLWVFWRSRTALTSEEVSCTWTHK